MAASERWVGVDDVAAHLGVAKDSVYRWIDERGLPAHRVGRLFRFKLSEIDEWVRQDNDPSAPRTSRQAGREKTPNSIQSRPSSKTQTNRSTPKTRPRKRGGNE
jgi:excisionase family DNA binding protein